MTKAEKTTHWDRINGWSTVVIAFCTLINLFVSYGLWKATMDATGVTRAIYEAANRPYLGSDGFEVHNDPKRHSLFIRSNVKNFGSVPATGDLTWKWSVDGKEQQAEGGVPRKSVIVFPGQSVHTDIQFGLDLYDAIEQGRSMISVRIVSKYRGASDKSYGYCEDEQYVPHEHGLAAVGACDQ